MAATLADDLGDVVLRVIELVGERLIAARLFQRIEIAALDVLDDRQFERFGVADVREFMGRKVYDTIIPRNVRVSEAPSYGKPVLVYDLKCVGSEAYLRLATEIIQREKELRAAS